MKEFDNKVVLVTGGGTGIGKAIASEFVAAGARVVIVGRRKDVLVQTSSEFGSSGAYITGDISKSGEAKKFVSETIETFGSLDILINNAGTASLCQIGRAHV